MEFVFVRFIFPTLSSSLDYMLYCFFPQHGLNVFSHQDVLKHNKHAELLPSNRCECWAFVRVGWFIHSFIAFSLGLGNIFFNCQIMASKQYTRPLFLVRSPGAPGSSDCTYSCTFLPQRFFFKNIF